MFCAGSSASGPWKGQGWAYIRQCLHTFKKKDHTLKKATTYSAMLSVKYVMLCRMLCVKSLGFCQHTCGSRLAGLLTGEGPRGGPAEKAVQFLFTAVTATIGESTCACLSCPDGSLSRGLRHMELSDLAPPTVRDDGDAPSFSDSGDGLVAGQQRAPLPSPPASQCAPTQTLLRPAGGTRVGGSPIGHGPADAPQGFNNSGLVPRKGIPPARRHP